MSIQKRPHLVWKERHRTDYLDEFIRWEGRGDFRWERACPDCYARGVALPGAPDHRCSDCCLPDLVCASCCVRRHRCLPFHRIEVCRVDSTVLSIDLPGVVLTIFMINLKQMPAQSYLNFQVCYEMKNLWQLE